MILSLYCSQKRRLPEWKTDQQLSNAREGPRMGTTNHKAHRGTQESVEVLNVLIIVVVTRLHVFVKTQNCIVNSMNITVCKLYLLKRPTISRSNKEKKHNSTKFKYVPFLSKLHFNILKTNYLNTCTLTDNRT